MATHSLAVIINNPSDEDEFLLLKQTHPPKFNDPEYDSYKDSDLWDLPSAPLTPLQADPSENAQPLIEGLQSCSPMLDLRQFDVNSSLDQVLQRVGFEKESAIGWKFFKCTEEPEFGPGLPIKTVYIVGKLEQLDVKSKEFRKWTRIESCLNMLLEVKPSNDRVGPLVVVGLLNDSMQSENLRIPSTLRCQEYPPGVKLVPMGSRTTKPFRTTNLVVFVPGTVSHSSGNNDFLTYGDALIVDPGCMSSFHNELKEIVAVLPRKLIVFVTHHHHDHVDGLSIIQNHNPEATLLAHEKTMCRIPKDDWALGYVSVSGNEEICIGGQQLRVISAPGHTDGHMALLHVRTNSLIVGDHCVGQGSALLDITSGGNMKEYFHTTYNFLELSPSVLIPLHGRVNLWPNHMLCGYLKNRRSRESTILKAIEGGAKTLFDIVAYTYADVDRAFWVAATSNVRLHVDHLAQQDKLPKEFSVQRFESSCRLHFLSRWLWAYISGVFPVKHLSTRNAMLVGAVTVAGYAIFCTVKSKVNPK